MDLLLVDITKGDQGALPAGARGGGDVGLGVDLLLLSEPAGGGETLRLSPAPHPGSSLEQAEPAPRALGVGAAREAEERTWGRRGGGRGAWLHSSCHASTRLICLETLAIGSRRSPTHLGPSSTLN